jgi:signal transduction histidine kinase
LTDSIARFQREMSQKERLTSLGRLSTVIAHEIRNPLMIIKASLHALRRPDASAAAVSEAVADIDEETARLNRIVNDVLDFARPVTFELAPTDLNALCRDSAAASEKSAPGGPVGLDLDPWLPAVTTDAERLRIALVNMLVNARQAVNGGGPRSRETVQPQAAPDLMGPPDRAVTLRTELSGNRAAIIIADSGVGIEARDLPHVFDPYFTTKRGGTGLGLSIAKNLVEGLGGALTVSSVVGRGTDVRIEIPLTPSAR